MTVTVDKSGRVLIPKAIRDRLGITPGTPLTVGVHDAGDGAPTLELRPEATDDALTYVNGVLVHVGRLPPDFDTVEFIRQQRDERSRKLSGLG